MKYLLLVEYSPEKANLKGYKGLIALAEENNGKWNGFIKTGQKEKNIDKFSFADKVDADNFEFQLKRVYYDATVEWVKLRPRKPRIKKK